MTRGRRPTDQRTEPRRAEQSHAPTGRIKIGELARRAGVSRATIHHYVREGLLPEPVKTSPNQARYDPDCVDRVLLIKGLQQHHRRSLSEVRALLKAASGDEGLKRLRSTLELEASRSKASLLDPARARQSLSRAALAQRTGFSTAELSRFEQLGLLTPRRQGGRKIYGPVDVDVADAMAALAAAGFDGAHGFGPEDVAIYLQALRSLLHEEVSLFLRWAARSEQDPAELLGWAEQAIERVTPLLLALRRKLIREFIDAAPIGE